MTASKRTFRLIGACLLAGALGCVCRPPLALSQTATPPQAGAQSAGAGRDGQHNFDFNIGTWRTSIRRLRRPLTGSGEWVNVSGTVTVSKVWNGRANLEEIEADGPTGHLQGLTLRLYNPESRQWYLYWSNSSTGTLGQPGVGEFRNGRGEFYDQEVFNGRTILVRQVYSDITANSYRFEQSFSDDVGKTWEPNWVATLTRVSEGARATPSTSVSTSAHSRATGFEPRVRHGGICEAGASSLSFASLPTAAVSGAGRAQSSVFRRTQPVR